MRTIYLKEFIKTGAFGPISMGISKDDLILHLGEDFDYSDVTDTQIIKYGWYEFFYWTEAKSIFGIQNDHLQADCLNHGNMIYFQNDRWKLDPWFLKENRHTSLGQVIEQLEQEQILFEVVPVYSGASDHMIRCLKSRVALDFTGEYRQATRSPSGKIRWTDRVAATPDEQVLNGIRLFDY